MTENTPSHDDFIRKILSNKEIAREYFENYLPDFVKRRLNFSDLKQLPDSYLSDDLKKTLSDIVYSCRLNSNFAVAKFLRSSDEKLALLPIFVRVNL